MPFEVQCLVARKLVGNWEGIGSGSDGSARDLDIVYLLLLNSCVC